MSPISLGLIIAGIIIILVALSLAVVWQAPSLFVLVTSVSGQRKRHGLKKARQLRDKRANKQQVADNYIPDRSSGLLASQSSVPRAALKTVETPVEDKREHPVIHQPEVKPTKMAVRAGIVSQDHSLSDTKTELLATTAIEVEDKGSAEALVDSEEYTTILGKQPVAQDHGEKTQVLELQGDETEILKPTQIPHIQVEAPTAELEQGTELLTPDPGKTEVLTLESEATQVLTVDADTTEVLTVDDDVTELLTFEGVGSVEDMTMVEDDVTELLDHSQNPELPQVNESNEEHTVLLEKEGTELI